MKVSFNNEYKKQFVELLPSVAVSWYGRGTLYIGWLVWNLTVEL
jgi:hypothetical protein